MTHPRKVHLNFTGCRLNEAEIERMARQFAARGDAITPSPDEADLVVINTCAVTSDAARKSRQMIWQAARANPQVRIIATGCYAELQSEAVESMPGVSQVIKNSGKDELVSLVSGEQPPLFEREPLAREVLPPGTLGRTRAFIKAQDGCDNRCAFCITTIARGKGRSRTMDDIVEEINLLADAGYQEVVLTGVHLGSYGHDLGHPRGLSDLVQAILAHTKVPRVRLSSLEPWDLDADFFELWTDPRLCPHLHLPLQSGCDVTLRRMARHATQATFSALVEAARSRIGDLSITTDIIVGFPGETDSEFAESLVFVEAMQFTRLHVFTYSQRLGTSAARMRDQIPASVKRERYARMTALSATLREKFERSRLGRVYDVLWEGAHGATPEGFVWSGLTGNYMRVFTASPDLLNNHFARCRLDGLTDRGVSAELC